MEERIRELGRQLGRRTPEVEILKEALDKSRSKKPTWLAPSQPKGGFQCAPWPRPRTSPDRTGTPA